MAQLTIRLDEALAERVKQVAAARGRSMNRFAVDVMTAAVDPENEDSEIARVRAKLAAAGLLESPDPTAPLRARPPSEQQLAAARAAAGRGTPLSELVSDGRG